MAFLSCTFGQLLQVQLLYFSTNDYIINDCCKIFSVHLLSMKKPNRHSVSYLWAKLFFSEEGIKGICGGCFRCMQACDVEWYFHVFIAGRDYGQSV